MPLTDERQLIRDAMDRLLAGKPIRSNGAPTIVALAEEAGVKRYLLTHRHVDLKDEFYAKLRAQGNVPQSEVDLRSRISALEVRVNKLRTEKADLESEVAILRRMNNVLAVEKARMEAAMTAVRSGDVSSIWGDGAGRSPRSR